MLDPLTYASDIVLKTQTAEALSDAIADLSIPNEILLYMAMLSVEALTTGDATAMNSTRAFGDGVIFTFAFKQAIELNALEEMVK